MLVILKTTMKNRALHLNYNQKMICSKKKNLLILKKEDLVFSNKDLEVQNSNAKDAFNKKIKNDDNIEKRDIKKEKNKLSLNLNTKKTDSFKDFEDPMMTVNFLHEGLKKISSNNNSDLKNVLKVINRTYDAEKMLKMIIGAGWKNQENEKKRINYGL